MAAAAAPEPGAAALAVYRLPLDPPSDQEVPAEVEARAWIRPLLQQNAVWFCRLRWLVIATLALAGLSGFFPHVSQVTGLAVAPAWPLTSAALLGALNLVFTHLARRTGEPGNAASVRLLLWSQIVADLLVLTAVVHWLDRDVPAAAFMYLFHIILACIVFPPRESLAVAALAAAFYLSSLWLDALGVLAHSPVVIRHTGTEAGNSLQALIHSTVLPLLIIWAVIWYLVSRLTSALRARNHELFMANLRLNASVEERFNHMLQTTHQLKSPFAAIHAQTQLLLGDYCGALSQQARVVVGKMAARCLALARQIQEMLQLANLRSQSQAPSPKRRVDLSSLIEDVINRIEPAALQRDIHIEKDLEPVAVQAVEDHLTMLVDNLIVNAVNYSYDHGLVSVACHGQNSGGAVLVVRDRGIGIPKEKLPRIFDDYYRTEEAAQHNRGATGLGLAIVRQVAWEHHLPVLVESAPGWGTRFTLTVPGASAALHPNRTTANI